MKLAAIYNVWADWDWLKLSVKNIRPLVDVIVIVCSHKSNYGEMDDGSVNFADYSIFESGNAPIYMYQCEPILSHPMHEETRRRNEGLNFCRKSLSGVTHFIMMDADEFYEPEAFLKEKQRFIDNPNLAGLVCASQVYVKEPTLTIGLDTTLVPFIHKITPTLKHEFNRSYPYAWEGKNIRIDPTRSLNINSGVGWSSIVMDHYSWVRRDISRKIRNSTARANIEKTTIVQTFPHLKEGSICEIYPGKPLVRVPNKYGLPDFDVVQDLQRDSKPLETGSSTRQ